MTNAHSGVAMVRPMAAAHDLQMAKRVVDGQNICSGFAPLRPKTLWCEDANGIISERL